MFLLRRNRPLLPSVAWGGRTHAAPFGAGENPGQPYPFPHAPRGAGVCSSASRDREGAGRRPSPPPPLAGRPRPEGGAELPAGKECRQAGSAARGETFLPPARKGVQGCNPCRTRRASDGKVRLSGSRADPGRGSAGHYSFRLARDGRRAAGGVSRLACPREAKRRAGGHGLSRVTSRILLPSIDVFCDRAIDRRGDGSG